MRLYLAVYGGGSRNNARTKMEIVLRQVPRSLQARLVVQRREIWRGVGGGVRGRSDWPVIAGVGLDPQRSDLG